MALKSLYNAPQSPLALTSIQGVKGKETDIYLEHIKGYFYIPFLVKIFSGNKICWKQSRLSDTLMFLCLLFFKVLIGNIQISIL